MMPPRTAVPPPGDRTMPPRSADPRTEALRPRRDDHAPGDVTCHDLLLHSDHALTAATRATSIPIAPKGSRDLDRRVGALARLYTDARIVKKPPRDTKSGRADPLIGGRGTSTKCRALRPERP